MRAAIADRPGLAVAACILAVVVGLGALVALSNTRGGADPAQFRAAANRVCAAAEQSLTKLGGRDAAKERAVLEHEYAQLRALRRPRGQRVEAGEFIAARGQELTRAKLVAWGARRVAGGGDVAAPAVLAGGTSASRATDLGLTDCAKRGVLNPNAS